MLVPDLLSPHCDLLSPRGILRCVVLFARNGASAPGPGHFGTECMVEFAAEGFLVLLYAGEGFL